MLWPHVRRLDRPGEKTGVVAAIPSFTLER